jgi:hypothetical protein
VAWNHKLIAAAACRGEVQEFCNEVAAIAGLRMPLGPAVAGPSTKAGASAVAGTSRDGSVILPAHLAMLQACSKFKRGDEVYKPLFTYVTVQKRHNTRLFPGDEVRHMASVPANVGL